jgi:hypothetical protein
LSFSSGAPAVFLRKGYAGNVTLCRVLVVVQITSFLPSRKGLEFQVFDRVRQLLKRKDRTLL